jgi:hypothetical protein
MLGASLILLAAVGCVHNGFLAQQPAAPRYARALNGTPASVAAALEAGFDSIDLLVLRKRDKGEIRLVGTALTGRPFCVHVRRGASAATTVVRVQWDGEPDERLWESIVGWLAVCAAQKDNPPEET